MKNLNLIITAIPSFPNAPCATVASPDSWFPEGSVSPSEQKLVKRICDGCDYKIECFNYSIEHEIEYGTWGGVTQTERLQIIRRGRKSKKTRPSILPSYEKLLQLRKDGMSSRAIAERYDVSIDGVNQAMRRGAIRAGGSNEAA